MSFSSVAGTVVCRWVRLNTATPPCPRRPPLIVGWARTKSPRHPCLRSPFFTSVSLGPIMWCSTKPTRCGARSSNPSGSL
eukprot:6149764-Pyramimonas_sp.AAC.1